MKMAKSLWLLGIFAMAKSLWLLGMFAMCVMSNFIFSSIVSPIQELELPEIQLRRSQKIPLEELVGNNLECTGPNLTAVPDTILPLSVTHKDRKIPKIVHMTSRSRCLTPRLYENHKKWRLQNHSFFFHDDQAVDRLLSLHFEEFPGLADIALHCLPSGAAKADLWRYVVLWEYGGIYTDVDQAPGKYINATSIHANDDSFSVIEGAHMLSQYFIAASPRHPLMFLAIQASILGLTRVTDVGNQYVPRTTGPEALRIAFQHFMGGPEMQESNAYKNMTAGYYVGINNRSTTVVGEGGKGSKDWILRWIMSHTDKKENYVSMGMKHFDDSRKATNDSCWQRLYIAKAGMK